MTAAFMTAQPGGAPARMDYIKLINRFWQLRREVPFSSTEADLYFYLLDVCNGLVWKNPFQQSNALICATLGVSEKTLIAARNRLKQAGLIDFTSGHKRNPSTYRLAADDQLFILEKLQPIRELTDSTSDSISGSVSGGGVGENPSDINKHKPNKTKPHTPSPPAGAECVPAFESKPEEIPAQSVSPTQPTENTGGRPAAAADDFATFWDSFDKKEDRHKCSLKWKSLSAADRAAALGHVPRYVQATPEKRYRKNPLTYLNGRCWLDELPDRTSARMTGLLTPLATKSSATPQRKQSWN